MNDAHSLSHRKWNCKYHIVFAPKYRRKVFYKISAEYPSACWGDESGLVRNLEWGGSLSRNAPQLAVGQFTVITDDNCNS